MGDVTVRRMKKVNHVEGCRKLRTAGTCPFKYEGSWLYDIRFRWPSGREYRERKRLPVSALSQSKALAWARERRNNIMATGEAAFVKAQEAKAEPAPTLKEFAPTYISDYCKANRNKPRTVERKEADIDFHLIPRFGNKRLDEISLGDIQRLKGDLIERDPKTVNNILSVLRTLLAFAFEIGASKTIPVTFKQLKLVQAEVEFYEPMVYEHIVAVAKELDPRAYIMVLMGGDAGMRRGEMVATEWRDVDYQRAFLHIQRSESKGYVTLPKGGRTRRVEMTTRLAAALRDNRHARGPRVFWRDPEHPGQALRQEGRVGPDAAELDGEGSASSGARDQRQPPHPPPHVLLAARDGWGCRPWPSRNWRAHEPHDDTAVHAPLAGPRRPP